MKKITSLFLFIMIISCSGNAQETKKEAVKSFKIQKTETEWKKLLSPQQYYVLREEGTEKPFTGKFLLHKEEGVYSCAGCGNPLFTDEMKFDSHCGWPSFDKEISGGKIITKDDYSLGVKRTEIECAKCGGHLGHLFDDGPTETGLRYCVNSLSLDFIKKENVNKVDTITLGGGCFWCVEGVYELIDGVIEVKSGYSGGKTKNPTYKKVCSGTTGHAEVVQVIYQPSMISLEEILQVFFTAHDPTTLNRQGADIGTQYRSVIFFHTEKQKNTINKVIKILKEEEVFDLPIVTQVSPISDFYTAEGYHQDYYELNKSEPYCKMVILPKIEKVKKVFKEQLK